MDQRDLLVSASVKGPPTRLDLNCHLKLPRYLITYLPRSRLVGIDRYLKFATAKLPPRLCILSPHLHSLLHSLYTVKVSSRVTLVPIHSWVEMGCLLNVWQASYQDA